MVADVLVPAALGGVDDGVVGHPMARAALVDARLDASLRRRGTNLAAHLGERHGRPASSLQIAAVVGRGATIDAVLTEVVEAVAGSSARFSIQGRAAQKSQTACALALARPTICGSLA